MIRLLFLLLIGLFVYFVWQMLRPASARRTKKLYTPPPTQKPSDEEQVFELERDEKTGVYKPKNNNDNTSK